MRTVLSSVKRPVYRLIAVALSASFLLSVGRVANDRAMGSSENGILVQQENGDEDNDSPSIEELAESTASELGWSDDFHAGMKMISRLEKAASSCDATKATRPFIGRSMCFLGTSTSSSHDLILEKGYYLRIVTSDGKVRRYPAIESAVLVRGRVLDVFVKNKVIVIKVLDGGWKLLLAV